ncbi:MAG: flagellar biosynthesis protein FliQ [Gemmatimonadaceae bacterium]|nr:flagellar biosynthesis protein FliQ [Gemmatimonadaceae bacterium]
MSDAAIVALARHAMSMALLLAAPMLVAALLVGIAVSVLQAVTQVQEATLSFVPKLLAVAGVALIALPWLIQTAVKYATEILRSLPGLAS